MSRSVKKSDNEQESLRIDKWLWAARFFKTRALASEAVSGGKVHFDGHRIKPSKLVRVGDRISVHRGLYKYDLFVEKINGKRGPAREAVTMYRETEESQQQREQQIESARIQRAAQPVFSPGAGRPTKRDRRQQMKWRDDQSS